MRFIPTRIHGIIDYVVGLLLIIAPFILGFATGGPAMWVPIIVGASIILYSIATRYEMGLFGALNMRTHLVLDALGGAFLAVSPWLFGFSEIVWVPHLLVGLFEIGTALTTHTAPESMGARGRHTSRTTA